MSIKRPADSWLKVNPFDILIFMDNKEGKMATWTELENYFVKGRKEIHVSTQTLSNYLKILLSWGLVTKTIDEKTLQPVYVVKNPIKVPMIETVRNIEKALVRAIEQNEKNWEQLSSHFLLEFELGYLLTKAYAAIYSYSGKSPQEIEEIINKIESKLEKLHEYKAEIELVEKTKMLHMKLKNKLDQLRKKT